MSGEAGAQDGSQFTLFNPTPPDQMRSFSTDRPKSNGMTLAKNSR
jgi:hypothetical protein